MKRTLMTAALVAAMCLALPVSAQDARPPGDPLAEQVFPPELILQHQKAIGLTDAQRNALVAEIKRVQGTLLEQQIELSRSVERLLEIMKSDRVDEAQALAQLDLVLAAEREVKRNHILLAVRLKNLLTPEQMQKLRALRAAAPAAKP